MSSNPKAIQTRYKGYRFRSRLEARWAVFFDHLGIEWQYEPEGYDLSEYAEWFLGQKVGLYLPDFWLPTERAWVEIKGALPESHFLETIEECEMAALCRHTKANAGYVFYGQADAPGFVTYMDSDFNINRSNEGAVILEFVGADINGAIKAAKSARFEFRESGAR